METGNRQPTIFKTMKPILFLFSLFLAFGLLAQSDKSYAKTLKKHRRNYKKEFLKEERSPLDKKGTKKLSFYAPNATYKTQCQLERTKGEAPFEMATYAGTTQPYIKYGIASCTFSNEKIELSVYQSLRLIRMPQYKDYLFIPFKDTTNGTSTYGGGRYMDISIKDIQDNQVVLDFNKAYNPWCAYSDGFQCPIPPLENHLEIGIYAGEKNFGKN